ncbi:MAG: hypothetical protein HXY40_07370 [Chloroflexi bacterium]|nr:hypothetical protein [Chloroflexota bacterium]
MSEVLLTPPLAFVIYGLLAGALLMFGRVLAGGPRATTTYHSGEELPEDGALPSYRGYFIVALFFAILHMGILMLGSGGQSWIAGIYVVGMLLALLALILG